MPTIAAIHSRIRSASPRWLPSNRRGRTILRMENAVATPISASTQNTSDSASYQPQSGAESGSTISIIAMKIAGNSTMKAQKMNACIRPGISRCSSLRWPTTTTASARSRSGTSSARAMPGAAPIRTSRASSQTRRPNSVAETAIAAASAIALAITSRGPSGARR